MATAPIAGTSSEKSPVISTTIIITAMGALEIPPKREIMPTTTKTGIVDTWMISGKKVCSERPTAPPTAPPMTSPGANTPPLPPDPIVSEVVMIFMKGRIRRTASGSMLYIESCMKPYPAPRPPRAAIMVSGEIYESPITRKAIITAPERGLI